MITLKKGDCYELIKEIPDNSIDLVYIDPPYIVEHYGGCNTPVGKRIQKVMGEIEGIRDGYDMEIFDELCRVMKGIYIYIWCSKEQIYETMKYFIEKGARMNILVWCKTNPIPAVNDTWLPDIEYCLLFKKDAPRYNDGYELKSRWYISATNKKEKDTWQHPTIKPLELVERHIKHSTKEGDTVLDCFMGSGTTGVACRNLNRNFIGFEINDAYFEIAEKRIKSQYQEFKLF